MKPLDLVDEKTVAEILSVPVRTVEDWRYRETGPPYYRLGRSVRYDRAELAVWLKARRVSPSAWRH